MLADSFVRMMPPENVAPATTTVCGGGPKLLGPGGKVSKSMVMGSAAAEVAKKATIRIINAERRPVVANLWVERCAMLPHR